MGVCNEKYKTILITNFCKCKKIKLQQNYLGGEPYGVYWMWKRIKRIFILYLCWKFFVFLLQIHVIESKGVVEKKKVKMNDNTHTHAHTLLIWWKAVPATCSERSSATSWMKPWWWATAHETTTTSNWATAAWWTICTTDSRTICSFSTNLNQIKK